MILGEYHLFHDGEDRHIHEVSYNDNGNIACSEYDLHTNSLSGWLRQDGHLEIIAPMDGWRSPRLGIRFDFGGVELQIIRPDGRPFMSLETLDTLLQQADQRADAERHAPGDSRSDCGRLVLIQTRWRDTEWHKQNLLLAITFMTDRITKSERERLSLLARATPGSSPTAR